MPEELALRKDEALRLEQEAIWGEDRLTARVAVIEEKVKELKEERKRIIVEVVEKDEKR